MSKLEVTGQIIVLKDAETFPSGFTKREFVVETKADKYPQKLAMQFVKDSCVKLDAFNIGDEVRVECDVRGSEHNGRYFVNLSAWKIELIAKGNLGAVSKEYGQQERPTHQNGAKPPAKVEDEEDSDIPF